MLSAAQQCDGLESAGTLASVHSADGGRGRFSHSEIAQETETVEAHILVCFLAYVLWKTLGQLCQRAGLGDEPRKVFQELAEVTLVDVLLPTRSGVTVRKRCISRPTEHQAILLQRLHFELPSSLEMTGV
jgi:hypothetical protein